MVLEWMILAMWTRLVRVDLVDVFFSQILDPDLFLVEGKKPMDFPKILLPPFDRVFPANHMGG